MNLQKLNETIRDYRIFLEKNARHDPYWRWESQRIFQENWDAEALDFRSMYDRSLQNSQTRRLWRRENYEPKDMMLRFIEMNREYVRQAFQDLFNENKEVEGRLGRFVFHCDELLREYRELHPATRLDSHYHDDNFQMASVYLAFRYPALYAPYDFENFRNMMEVLGSRDVPQVNDAARYFKVLRTVSGFLKKEELVVRLHQKRLNPALHFTGDTLLVAADFCQFVAGRWG